jgi:hypothetical protein
MKERNDAMAKINKLFTEEFWDSVFYPYFQYEAQLINILVASFDYDDVIIRDWIEYYCYELDFGRQHQLGDVEENGVSISLGTPEELYDFLFEEACGYEKGFKKQ